MLMEMKLCYNDKFKGLNYLPEFLADYIENKCEIKESKHNNGLVITLKEPKEITYEFIKTNAQQLGIQIFDRKALYVSLSEMVTEEMYHDPENWLNPEDPYYTKKDVGKYKMFAGLHANSFHEAEEIAKRYGYPERNLQISIRVIEEGNARAE
jgi:hypothetical protein